MKKSFKDAYTDFMFSGGTGRTIAILLLTMASMVGVIYMLADLFS